MRRIHIAVTLFAVLLLMKPFDCLAGAFSRKAAACCAKGKCLPTSNADECCKGTVPAGDQLSTTKISDHVTPLPTLVAVVAPISIALRFLASPLNEAHAPP